MREDDLPPLAAMYMRSFPSSATGEHWCEDTASALLGSWLKRQPDLAFVATAAGEGSTISDTMAAIDFGRVDGADGSAAVLAGACLVGVRPWWDGNHLVDGEFFVDPLFQAKGVGTALLRHVLAVAKEKYNPVCWDSYTFREEGFPLSWYKKLGFEEIDEWVMIRAPIDKLLSSLG